MITKVNISNGMRRHHLCLIALLLLFSGSLTQWVFAFDYPEPGDFAQGSKLWAENCTRCHNMRSPTDLRDDQWVTSVFHMRIRAGLTGGEARDILTFLQGSNASVQKVTREKFTPPANDPVTVSGANVYENNCAACHGVDGSGVIPGVPDFNATNGRLSKARGELLNSIINGYKSPGSVMAMPPRGGNGQLSNTDLSAALDYIKSAFGH